MHEYKITYYSHRGYLQTDTVIARSLRDALYIIGLSTEEVQWYSEDGKEFV